MQTHFSDGPTVETRVFNSNGGGKHSESARINPSAPIQIGTLKDIEPKHSEEHQPIHNLKDYPTNLEQCVHRHRVS